MIIILIFKILLCIEAKKQSDFKELEMDKFPDTKWMFPKPQEALSLPVPFGHIPIDGIDDPFSDHKVPIDLLELTLRYPVSPDEQKIIEQTVPRNRILPLKKDPMVMTREQFIENEQDERGRSVTAPPKKMNRPQSFNFQEINQVNVENPKPERRQSDDRDLTREGIFSKSAHNLDEANHYDKSQHFIVNKFELIENLNNDRLNWTTCEEFSKGGIKNQFHPKDVVDIDWEPFFVWTLRETCTSVVHRFSYPLKKTVKEYKQTYGPYLDRPVDWEEPKLLLNIDLVEMLIIAGDRNGLFHGITRGPITRSIKERKVPVPLIPMRFKIIEPYLAMMRCDDLYAIIMASPGTEPISNDEKWEEAKGLKFVGKGFPVSRDKIFEEQREAKIIEIQREAEETKYLPIQ